MPSSTSSKQLAGESVTRPLAIAGVCAPHVCSSCCHLVTKTTALTGHRAIDGQKAVCHTESADGKFPLCIQVINFLQKEAYLFRT
jgi:hypothetical protein